MHGVVVEAARFLGVHAGEQIRLADVADHVGYSPFHLARSFDRHLGISPGRFLAAQRFQTAKRLLLDADDRVIDICYAAGFASHGTFATRFAALVGSSPTEFRRLPHVLADSPPEPLVVPGGARAGDVVSGSVRLSPAAAATLGDGASVYVGLFPRPSPWGFPVAGALLPEPGDFSLTGVPPGTYYLLASAVPTRADFRSQLVPGRAVAGSASRPVRVVGAPRRHRRDLCLDVAEDWCAPVLVALPRLACPSAQDWRRRRTPLIPSLAT